MMNNGWSPLTSTDTGSACASWTRASKSSAHGGPLAPTRTQCTTGVASSVPPRSRKVGHHGVVLTVEHQHRGPRVAQHE